MGSRANTTASPQYGSTSMARDESSSSQEPDTHDTTPSAAQSPADNGAAKKDRPVTGLHAVIRWLQPELVNSGSTARDHLANERTTLAWLRSSLSLASIGIAVTQLFRLTTVFSNPNGNGSAGTTSASAAFVLPAGVTADEAVALLAQQLSTQQAQYAELLARSQAPSAFAHLGKPVGGSFIAVGILLLLLGTMRYFLVQSALQKGVFPPARKSVILAASTTGALVVATFAVILAFR